MSLIKIFRKNNSERPLFSNLLEEVPKPDEVYITLEDFQRLVKVLKVFEDGLERDAREVRNSIRELDQEVDDRIRVMEENFKAKLDRLAEEREEESSEVEDEEEDQQQNEEKNGDDSSDNSQRGAYVLAHEQWISPFSGEGIEVFTTWVEKLEDLMDLSPSQLTDEQKCSRVKFHLTGLARAYFNSLTEEEKKNYVRVKTALKTKFEGEKTRLEAEDAIAALTHKGRVSELALQLRELVKIALQAENEEAMEKRLLAEFLRKLSSEIKFQVKLHEPNDFQSAVDMALKVEGLLAEKGNKGTDVAEKLDGIAKMIQNSNRAQQSQPFRGRREPVKCHFCGILGHVYRDCRKRLNQGNFGNQGNFASQGNFGNQRNFGNQVNTNGANGGVKCYNCGIMGHTSRFCRRGNANSGQPAQGNQSNWDPQQAIRFANNANRAPWTGNGNGIATGANIQGTSTGGQARANQFGAQQKSANVIVLTEKSGADGKEEKLTQEKLEMEINELKRQNENLGKLFNKSVSTRPGSKYTVGHIAKVGKSSTNSLFLGTLLVLSLVSVTFCNPMLCQTATTPTLWKIPESTICNFADFRGTPKSTEMTIFKPNLKQYVSEGILCRKVRTDIKYTTSIWGKHEIRQTTTQFLPSSKEECRAMHFDLKCEYGTLAKTENWWATNNTATLEFPSRWEAIFEEAKIATEFNCFFSKRDIIFEHGADSISSPNLITNHCKYEKGGCLISHHPNSFIKKPMYLTWVPDSKAFCSFLAFATWEGTKFGNVWFANNKEFALTFPNKTEIVYDCGNKLAISDKRFAVLEENFRTFHEQAEHRGKREANGTRNEGVTFAGDEAARLQALEEVMRETIQFAFSKAARAICEAENEARLRLSATAAANPTLAARAMLKSELVQARLVTARLLQVWPCTPILKENIRFNRGLIGADNCYKFLPVLVDFNGKNFSAFIDPLTGIVSKVSPMGPCPQFRQIFMEWFENLIVYDQILGTAKTIRKEGLKEIKGFNYEFTLPEAVIFHAIFSYNFSEVFPSQHFEVDESEKSIEMRIRKVLPEIASDIWILHDLSKLSARIVKEGLFGFLVGFEFSPMQVWIFICCVYTSWRLFWDWIFPIAWRLLILAYPQLFFFSRGIEQRNANLQRKKRHNSGSGLALGYGGPSIIEMDEFIPNQFHRHVSSSSRMNRNNSRLEPIIEEVGVCESMRHKNYPNSDWAPTIEIEIDGNKVRAFIDTGAALSIANVKIISKIRRVKIHPVDRPIQGIAGSKREVIGAVLAEISGPGAVFMGSICLVDWPIFVDNYDCELLLGRDFLCKMPTLLVNCHTQHVSFLDAEPKNFPNLKLNDFDFVNNNGRGIGINKTANIGAVDWKDPEVKRLVEVYVNWSIIFPHKKGGLRELQKAISQLPKYNSGELINYIALRGHTFRMRKKLKDEWQARASLQLALAQAQTIMSLSQNIRLPSIAPIAADVQPGTSQKANDVDEGETEQSEGENTVIEVGMVALGQNQPNTNTNSQVVGKINGINLALLLDTGSQVTIGSAALLPALKIEKLDPICSDMVGVGGQQIRILGSKIVTVEIGGFPKETRMYFSDRKPAARSSEFEAIIGVDVMAQLPPITFDFSNWKVKIKENNLRLGIGQSDEGLVAQIRLLDSTLIPANSEAIVEGYISDQKGGNDSFWLIEKESAGLNKQLMATLPTVTELSDEGICPFLIINPTEKPVKLYQDMSLGQATKISASESLNSEIFVTQTSKIERDPEFTVDLEECRLSVENKSKLRELLDRFDDIFSYNSHDVGKCKITAPTIVTTSENAPKQKPFRAPFKLREEIRAHINKLIEMGVMKESDTPWVSNLVLVAKKDGTLRPCIDFRKLNLITRPDYFPLPRIETVLEKIGGCEFYSSLDLSSGYMQIPLDEETSYKCGVITEDGTFQMTALPFGLKNASGIFSRTMAHVLFGLDEAVTSYIDDILVFTKSGDFDVHLGSLEKVFERMREFGLKLSPKKCIFARDEIPFLGHVIRCKEYAPAPRNLKSIEDFPQPQNLQQVRRFVGMASFFRRFISGFSEIVQPLTKLTKKVNKFGWGEEQQKAFVVLKSLLLKEPILTYPDYEKPFHIFCDASAIAQAGALMQKDEGTGKFRAISYCSRTMADREQTQPAVYSELGAIVFSLRIFRPFIYMAEIILHSDHKPLSFLLNKVDNPPKINRWIMELQELNLKIVHIAGTKNAVADAISRVEWGVEEGKQLSELYDCMDFPRCLVVQKRKVRSSLHLLDGDEPCAVMEVLERSGVFSTVDIKAEQYKDEDLRKIMDILTKKDPSELSADEKMQAANFVVQNNGCLYLNRPKSKRFSGGKCPIVVPKSLRQMVFEYFHASPLAGCHMGFNKTVKKSGRYWWSTKLSDFRQWCRTCITCQMRRNPRPGIRAPMTIIRNTAIMKRVGLDITGPFKMTERENRHILHIICWFSKFLISVPLQNTRSVTVARAFFENCVLKHGACVELITDSASSFTCDFFRDLCKLMGINKKYTTPYRSQGNATTERSFQSIQDALAKIISPNQSDWDLLVPFVTFCYNTSVHRTTGETPFFLMHGRDPLFNIDLILDPNTGTDPGETEMTEFRSKLVSNLREAWNFARDKSEKAQEIMKRDYDKKANEEGLSIGDRVLLINTVTKPGFSKKLGLPWDKQFRVLEVTPPHAIISSISAPHKPPKRVHINQIKRCHTLTGPALTAAEPSSEELNDLAEIGAEEMPEQNESGEKVVVQSAVSVSAHGEQPAGISAYKTRSGREVKKKVPHGLRLLCEQTTITTKYHFIRRQ